jgi:hypothetical protein
LPDENISQDRHRPQAEDLQTGRPANGIRGLDSPGSGSDPWLAVAASRYVHITGDLGALDECVGYIEGRAVNPGEDSDYDLPGRSTLVETHYDHCKRAIQPVPFR